jgi:catechol 2,3-dioxygenase-like lactoylglutathione lyase family enzyme
MLRSADLVAFTATTDLPRARDFYAGTLGLTVLDEDAYACILDAHGTHLRVTLVHEMAGAPYTVLGWSVPDVTATIRSLEQAGVTFERFEGMDQDDAGAWQAPNGARVAWFKDPDNNMLSVTQDAPAA